MAEIEGLRVMGREVLDGDARFALDETKVLLDIAGLGITGYAAEGLADGEWRHLPSGSATTSTCWPGFTLGNVDADADALVTAIRALATWAGTQRGKGRPPGMPRRRELPTGMAMTPAEAFFARTEQVPLGGAAGRVAAENGGALPAGHAAPGAGRARIEGPSHAHRRDPRAHPERSSP